ncbi:MAG: hypothetical protein HZR80_03565 [Candidatus Heimdallarchaeota archaeon]
MTIRKTDQQFTLKQMGNMLNSLESTDHQRILQVVITILPQFEDFLKTRPYSTKEANELFELYLQIRFWSKKISPHNVEKDYRKNWLGMQIQVAGLLANKWLRGMHNCLREVREYLYVNEVIKEGNPIEIEEIVLYLKQGDFFINKEQGKLLVHLDEDQYNEFGVEIKDVCFKEFKNK